MRIKINLSPTDKTLPKHNQNIVNSYIHKCLGKNNIYHDSKNNYSVSSLKGVKLIEGTDEVSFSDGGYIVVTSQDMEFLNKLIMGLFSNTQFGYGITYLGLDHIEEKFYNGWNHFYTLSPFIIKNYSSKTKYNFITLDDDGFEGTVKSYLMNKLNKIDSSLDLTDFDIKIPNCNSRKVRKVIVKNVKNVANACHISIHTNKKVAELLYNIGIGQSTGSGFGTIYKTENHRFYR